MRVGSLYSGIGGLEEGLERAGMTTIWQCESDEFCQEVLSIRFPHVKFLYEDVNWLTPAIRRHRVDLICGGFPCQPISTGGNMFWKEDERWLWPQFLQVIEWCRPRWVVIENVEGLRTRGMDDVLGSLADCGYDAEWDRLSASIFGAPHQRRRYFIVAYPQSKRNGNGPRIFTKPPGVGEAFYENCHPRSKRLCEVGAGTVEEIVSAFKGYGWWRTEPDVDRMAYGIPFAVDRCRSLGNAVIPQVAEWVGKRIMEVENGN